MKPSKKSAKSLHPPKKVVIRTTFLDLIGRLADIAKDDATLIASVRRILEACDVRFLPSMAPVRLAVKSTAPRKTPAIKTRPAWL
jgi:hypothetical protein